MSQTAAERAMLTQLIADCKAAVARHDDSSDSDETELAHGTNRGNKLKRKARQVKARNLDEPTGRKLSTEVVDYNGRQRMILYRNKSKREEVEERPPPPGRKKKGKKPVATVEEDSLSDDDPYASIRIEEILAQPIEPRDITTRPALARPYKSTPLTELCQQALDIINAEHKHVTVLKSLLTHFLGDDPFVTGEKMETVTVPKYIQEAQRLVAGRERARALEEEQRSREAQTQSTLPDNDIEMIDSGKGEGTSKPLEAIPGKSPIPKVEPPSPPEGFPDATATDPSAQSRSVILATQIPGDSMEADGSQTLPSGIDPQELIDATSPWFYPPEYDENSRNFGLPLPEAEETRQLLLMAVQKEEEFIRGLVKVREGLLKAERLRKNVWEWCRADAAPEPSDGEDYVDLEYWGLEEGDLQKGAEEEEEEDPKSKKTARSSRRN